MIILFGISNCDTVKKTRHWLEQQQLDYEFHDYKKQGCSTELAETFLSNFDLDKLINKRGTTWRKLPDTTKNDLNVDNAAELMVHNPSLIKRPILRIGKHWVLGYDETAWQSQLGKLP